MENKNKCGDNRSCYKGQRGKGFKIAQIETVWTYCKDEE